MNNQPLWLLASPAGITAWHRYVFKFINRSLNFSALWYVPVGTTYLVTTIHIQRYFFCCDVFVNCYNAIQCRWFLFFPRMWHLNYAISWQCIHIYWQPLVQVTYLYFRMQEEGERESDKKTSTIQDIINTKKSITFISIHKNVLKND